MIKQVEERVTGLKFGDDRICKSGETISSTKDCIDWCLEIDGERLFCQAFSKSFFSTSIARHLKIVQSLNNNTQVL